MALDEEES